jgi:hypothetical protein
MRRRAAAILAALLTACGSTAAPSPSPDATLALQEPLGLGAGFRYSSYGIGPNDPGPAYWQDVGEQMAARFDGAVPGAIWIVGIIAGQGTILGFPGTSEETTIHFRPEDANEAALDLFDESGFEVWLQVEPGDAPVDQLIDIVMERYGHHPSVIGFGVDVEWLESSETPEGRPVTDAEAGAWLAAIRAHDPDDRLFLKHWEADVMPPTARDGIVFVNDSQGFDDLDAMVAEFADWAEHFAPAQVGYQFGYTGDDDWWSELADPPGDIGRAILDAVPDAVGLYWVDFTIRDVFEPPE